MGQGVSCGNEEMRGQGQHEEQIKAMLLQQQLELRQLQQQSGQIQQIDIDSYHLANEQQLHEMSQQLLQQQYKLREQPLFIQQELDERARKQSCPVAWTNGQTQQIPSSIYERRNSNILSNNRDATTEKPNYPPNAQQNQPAISLKQQSSNNITTAIPSDQQQGLSNYPKYKHSQPLIGDNQIAIQQQQQLKYQQEQLNQHEIFMGLQQNNKSDQQGTKIDYFSDARVLQPKLIVGTASSAAVKPRFLSPNPQETKSTTQPTILDDNPIKIKSVEQTANKSPMRYPTQLTNHQEIDIQKQQKLSQQQSRNQLPNKLKIYKQQSLQPQQQLVPTSITIVPDFKIQKIHRVQSYEESKKLEYPPLTSNNKNDNNTINPKNFRQDQVEKPTQQSQQFQQPHSTEEEKSNDQTVKNYNQPQYIYQQPTKAPNSVQSSTSIGYETQERQMRTPSLTPSASSSQQAIQIQQKQLQFQQQENLMSQQQYQFKINQDSEARKVKNILHENTNPINIPKDKEFNISSQVPSSSSSSAVAYGRENINSQKNTSPLQKQQKQQLQNNPQQAMIEQKKQEQLKYQQAEIQKQQERDLNLKKTQLNQRSISQKRFKASSSSSSFSESSQSPPPSPLRSSPFYQSQESNEEFNRNYPNNTQNRHKNPNKSWKHKRTSRETSSKGNNQTGRNSHQNIGQQTRSSYRYSHKNNANPVSMEYNQEYQQLSPLDAPAGVTGQFYSEELGSFNSNSNLNNNGSNSSYNNNSYNQFQQEKQLQKTSQFNGITPLQSRNSVGNNVFQYSIQQQQPQQQQIMNPFQMNTPNLPLQQLIQTQQQPSHIDLIKQQLVQSQLALVQTQQNHQAQIQGILFLQQQQQQQQQLQQQQQQLQNQFGGIFPNIPNQMALTQLNQLNSVNQFPTNSLTNNNSLMPYQLNSLNTNNSSLGILLPPPAPLPIFNAGISEINQNPNGTNYLLPQQQNQQQQQIVPQSSSAPQQFPIIINNNVASPTKQMTQTHIGDNRVRIHADNNASNKDLEVKKINSQNNNKNTSHFSVETVQRQGNHSKQINMLYSSLSEVEQEPREEESNKLSKQNNEQQNMVEYQQANETLIPKRSESAYGTNKQSNLKNQNAFSECNKPKIEIDHQILNEIDNQQLDDNSNRANNKNQSKTLAEIFQEKRGKLAAQKIEEQQQQQQGISSNKVSGAGGAKRTKEEIIKLRQDMMEYGTRVNPKLKAKQQQKIQHADSDITGDILKEQRHKSPIYSKQKEELMIRLAQGVKPKISEKEMYALTKKNYENLPEVKKKRQEQEKQLNKSELLKVKQEKLKELDEKRRTQFQRKSVISQHSSPKINLTHYNSSNQLNQVEEDDIQEKL